MIPCKPLIATLLMTVFCAIAVTMVMRDTPKKEVKFCVITGLNCALNGKKPCMNVQYSMTNEYGQNVYKDHNANGYGCVNVTESQDAFCSYPEEKSLTRMKGPWCFGDDGGRHLCFNDCPDIENFEQMAPAIQIQASACILSSARCAKNGELPCQQELTVNVNEQGKNISKNVTKSGKACQKWTLQKPHAHMFSHLGDHNFCQNPDGAEGPWCYTTDSQVRSENCYETCGTMHCNYHETMPSAVGTEVHSAYLCSMCTMLITIIRRNVNEPNTSPKILDKICNGLGFSRGFCIKATTGTWDVTSMLESGKTVAEICHEMEACPEIQNENVYVRKFHWCSASPQEQYLSDIEHVSNALVAPETLRAPARKTKIVDNVFQADEILEHDYTDGDLIRAFSTKLGTLEWLAKRHLIANQRRCIDRPDVNATHPFASLVKRADDSAGYKVNRINMTSNKNIVKPNSSGVASMVIASKSYQLGKGRFFSQIHLELDISTRFMYRRCTNPTEPYNSVNHELHISKPTIVDWANFVRDIFQDWCHDHAPLQKLGGPGRIVEIDESVFYKTKYNRGQRRELTWVFGMVERGTNKVMVTQVPDRSAATLIPIIIEWILPQSKIMSDGWAAYGGINALTQNLNGRLQYLYRQHLWVNHKRYFGPRVLLVEYLNTWGVL